jgi:hypothetical protein
VQKIIANAVRWAAPQTGVELGFGNPGPIMPGLRTQ